MYKLVRSQHYFYRKIQCMTWDLIFYRIRINLSICDSNQTWDLIQRSLLMLSFQIVFTATPNHQSCKHCPGVN